MSEDQELQAKIAALSGRINLHKQAQNPEQPSYSARGRSFSQTDGAELRGHCDKGHYSSRGQRGWTPSRRTPYGSYRGRGSKSLGHGHRNRTLVLNNPTSVNTGAQNGSEALPKPTISSTTDANSLGDDKPASTGWVSKRDRHMQLINNSVFDQKSQQRAKEIAETVERKSQLRDLRETMRLQKHFQRVFSQNVLDPTHSNKAAQTYEINVDGIKFRVVDRGSKLIRIADDTYESKPTPKRTSIGGVVFFRSKSGNLYRAGLVKAAKKQTIKKVMEPCPKFTSTGQCSKGPLCRFVHDPEKVAVCKDFLAKGVCALGDSCDLSHECDPHRVPACLHFLRGNCTNDGCRYAHIRVNPSSSICRAFSKLGYCEKGVECSDRHVFECPDYANKGTCRNEKCRLPHVDRAGQIRKATAAAAKDTDDESPDPSSEDDDLGEVDENDIDSDGIEDLTMLDHGSSSGHELSQQQDFVGF